VIAEPKKLCSNRDHLTTQLPAIVALLSIANTGRNSLANVLPVVIEQSGMGERAFDIYSRLLRERIVFLGTPVDDQVADSIVAQLL
jgi:hypothetical protein